MEMDIPIGKKMIPITKGNPNKEVSSLELCQSDSCQCGQDTPEDPDYGYDGAARALLLVGDSDIIKDAKEWPNYLEAYSLGESDIPQLIQMLTDEALSREDAPESYPFAKVHAWRALGQLKALDAIQVLLELRYDKPDDCFWFCEESDAVFTALGVEAFPILESYFINHDHCEDLRASSFFSMSALAKTEPHLKDPFVSLIVTELENASIQTPELNGWLIGELMDIKVADQHVETITRLYKEHRVEESICGSLEDVLIEIGVQEPSPEYLAQKYRFRRYQKRLDTLDCIEAKAESVHRERAQKKRKAKQKQQKMARKKSRKH